MHELLPSVHYVPLLIGATVHLAGGHFWKAVWKQRPLKNQWERKRILSARLLPVSCSCLPDFTPREIIILGFKVAFSGLLGCQVPCSVMVREARISEHGADLLICRAANGLTPLVLREVTGHPQAEEHGGGTSGWGYWRWWNQSNLRKHIKCVPCNNVVLLLIFLENSTGYTVNSFRYS